MDQGLPRVLNLRTASGTSLPAKHGEQTDTQTGAREMAQSVMSPAMQAQGFDFVALIST